ncbi:MAG: phosphoadenylyl-sulfate reductase [Rhodobacteraceae bacterium]|nr:phosphoadenylyl-sulfate reductase [Paracoccaceae bacterium]
MMFQTNARADLCDKARVLSMRYGNQGGAEALCGAIREDFPGRIGLVSSFGSDSAVLLHMVAQIDPRVPVIFLQTQKHFPETIAYRDTLVRHLGLRNIQNITPRPAHLKADDPRGELHKSDPDLCCHVRKTLPLLVALRSLSCWITGRKRYQTPTRGKMALFEAEDRWIKMNPLAAWNAADIADYMRDHCLPEHPLKPMGYMSIGCAPCTRAVKYGEDVRAGRWAESDKTECGIHFVNGRMVRGAPG